MANSRFSFEEMAREARREVALRKRLYPDFVNRSKYMSQKEADYRLALMEAIAEHLESMRHKKDDLLGRAGL